MIEGVIHHCTEMEVDRQYVDSHGQSTVAFAFCRLLGFLLLPRLKTIHSQTLYRPETGKADAYADLQLILGKPIDWDLVRQQYDQMIKYTTALRLGTAETEAILRRFTKYNVQHPHLQGLCRTRQGHQDDLPMSVSAFEGVAPGDPRRPERGRAMERRHGFRVLRPPRRDGQQPPGRPRDQHALAAPDSELHGLRQYAHDSETIGTTQLAREVHTARLRRADAPDLGACEPVWSVRSGHELPIGSLVIEVAAGDTTVGFTPTTTRGRPVPAGPEIKLRWCIHEGVR
jgi:Tn3 transposase DDE domain